MPRAMKSVVCLISGRGSNLDALLRTAQQQRWDVDPGIGVRLVISTRPGVPGLDVARRAGVEAEELEPDRFVGREAFETELARRIDRCDAAVVVLAGFMRVLTPSFVARYGGRLLNIHPSLLPSFPGLDTHRRALAAGVRLHGATVHFVSEQLDAGPIIAQAAVPVLPDDTEATLSSRVLRQEHLLLPKCVRWVAEARVRLQAGRVVLDGVPAEELVTLAGGA
jgi:phosphoribosylglycinamide formyltransferase 1